jgi:hypothetical protein
MEKALTAIVIGVLGFAVTGTTFTADWQKGVVVSAHAKGHRSLDDRAIYACARSMVSRMFPGIKRIRVFTRPAHGDYEMAVLLKAADARTNRPLGSAKCLVSPMAQVELLRPGVKELPPGT